MKQSSSRQYHVQYFDVKALRGWVSASGTMLYEGQEAFEALCKAYLPQKNLAFRFGHELPKKAYRAKWDFAVSEADAARAMTRQSRLLNYTFIYTDNKDNKSYKDNMSNKDNKGNKDKKRKRSESTTAETSDDSVSDQDKKKLIKAKKKAKKESKESSGVVTDESQLEEQDGGGDDVKFPKKKKAKKLSHGE